MLKLDTLDKKPNLYHVLAEAILVSLLIAILAILDIDRHALTITFVIIVFLAALIVQLVIAFFRQIRFNLYSYNTIFYIGFAVFFVFVLITEINVAVIMIRQPGLHDYHSIISVLISSAFSYMLFTSPFLLVFSIALTVSNISLIRHEGRRFVNVLGIILAILIVGGGFALFRYNYYSSGSQFAVMMKDILVNLISCIYLYFESMLIGTIISGAIAAKYEPEKNKDFMIILGCGIRKDGTPSPLLRGRIDRALVFAEQQKEESGKDLIFITSGGQGPNEVTTESAAMKQYLLSQGVPAERIIEEEQSTSTYENMKFSKEKIDAVNPDGKVAFATTNYHVFRSGLMARRVKMRAVGIGAETKWYFWPNASVREFVGLITSHKGKQAMILGSMILFYTLFTIVFYYG